MVTKFRKIGLAVLFGVMAYIGSYVTVCLIISIYASVLSALGAGAPDPDKLKHFIGLVVFWVSPVTTLIYAVGTAFFMEWRFGKLQIVSAVVMGSAICVVSQLVSAHYGGQLMPDVVDTLFFLMVFAAIFLGIFWAKNFALKREKNVVSKLTKMRQSFALTEREAQIVTVLLEGKSNAQIAEKLFIEEGTVKNHLKSIFRKTDVQSRTQLIRLLLPSVTQSTFFDSVVKSESGSEK